MKSLNKLVALGAVLAASSSMAFADTLNGTFFVQGNDTYTPTSVSFGTASVGAGHDTGTTGITGTFETYLVDGDDVVFASPLNFVSGVTTTVTPPAQVVTIYGNSAGTGTPLYTFDVSSYTATYTVCTGQAGPPCYGNSGDTFLDIIGNGIFNSEGAAVSQGSSPGNFDFSSQTVDGNTSTDFSVSAGAMATPEPNSLLLLGTGLIGGASLLFMRRRGAAGIL